MEPGDLVLQIQRLKASLEETEKRLQGTPISQEILEDLKSTLDHTRMSVWGILTMEGTNLREVTARFRLKRVTELCQRIALDVAAGDMSFEYGDMVKLQATLEDTLKRMKRLY